MKPSRRVRRVSVIDVLEPEPGMAARTRMCATCPSRMSVPPLRGSVDRGLNQHGRIAPLHRCHETLSVLCADHQTHTQRGINALMRQFEEAA